ncbi:lysine-N-methylase [Citrobacter amalonaticus]|uniref:Lysine-N-methylase n=1 Tax=Citrobacter amalonaticus TaxID=35703 RepID=A0A2S4RRM4_CITAM|nr:lysine-N-methylase [Citrobacter amalonaticus]POT58663.1 lysine-N-methylase [Citrobacter amalonaticus]POT70401.1 lysine-N-methylase [Citrobacter amalonaticus]POU61385.1 lysine-N-methylase [Citrobacter amalonaticus]POV05047.1 lysine-N-methylase [Citrobacter amalonaticus]
MNMIECYEPDFVRSFLSHNPGSPLHTRMMWHNEIRQSLELTEAASCEAALGDPHAFVLHVSLCDAEPDSTPLSPRDRVLNQAALDTVTLAGLSPELRLYTLGIMLSWADKHPGESDETLASIASQPQRLANFVGEGKLQEQFALLPAVPQLQCRLLTLMGSLDFDWERLPESTRKTTLPLQVSLLMLQDANSEALLLQQLQEQWRKTHAQYFARQAWIFSNYLIYRLYNDMFPRADAASVTRHYFELVTDFVLLRTLFSLWTLDGSALTHNEIYALFALFERWRRSEDAAVLRQQLLTMLPANYLLSAFSLLIC